MVTVNEKVYLHRRKERIRIKKSLLLFGLLNGLLLAGCVKEENVVVIPPQQVETAIALKPVIDVGSGKAGLGVLYDKHCWETADKSCSLIPTPAEEFLRHERANQVIAGDELHLRFSIPLDDIDFPKPDSFELAIHKDGETTAVEVENNIAKVPMVEGRYYMSVKAIWSGDVKGEAIYAFLLSVKED